MENISRTCADCGLNHLSAQNRKHCWSNLSFPDCTRRAEFLLEAARAHEIAQAGGLSLAEQHQHSRGFYTSLKVLPDVRVPSVHLVLESKSLASTGIYGSTTVATSLFLVLFFGKPFTSRDRQVFVRTVCVVIADIVVADEV